MKVISIMSTPTDLPGSNVNQVGLSLAFFSQFIQPINLIKPDISKGACKYYVSTLGVGGGSEGNAYFAYVVRGDEGLEPKCLYCFCKGSTFLFT